MPHVHGSKLGVLKGVKRVIPGDPGDESGESAMVQMAQDRAASLQ